jgi:puromycin-sensitive aminopeptidase
VSSTTATDTGRLPRTVHPIRYDVSIAPDLDAGTFTGTVVIELDVLEPVDEIVLHAHDLSVELVSLTTDGAPVEAELRAEPERERIVVAGIDLEPGAARLELRFDGAISDGLVGFYRSTYKDDAGVARTLAATQFEAPHARRAFPCFDEPEFKAVFGITLDVAEDLVAISNGPEVGRTPLGDGRVRVRFGDTIAMSTYLVAYVIGPLEISDPVDVDGTPLRIVTVPGRGALGAFALEAGAFALRFFVDYYGIPYPGEKLDLVALPDFAFGAMENLGCVTFRESALLVDPDGVTHAEATQVALTITHEIAHMWFGDLVTMKWWNGIWLNEAFATFMEHAGVDAWRPEWRTWDDFALGRAMALDIDALSNTRPVEYEVRTPEDADGMFDILTYQKGGSVVRMLEQWLGADAFRDGVRHYLDRYRLANTETTDLWDAIEAATGRPVRRIMDSWIFQPGLPEVEVTEVDGGVRCRQRRFRYQRAGGDDATRWSIPMLVRAVPGGAPADPVLLDDEDTDVTTGHGGATGDGRLVVANAGGEGFYRVSYPEGWPERLVATGALSPRERFVLVDDAWAGVVAGTMPAAEFLQFAWALRDERDLIVWRILVARLRNLVRVVDPAALDDLLATISALVRPAFDALGWDPAADEGPRERQLRNVMIDLLGTVVRDREVVARAREYYDREGVDADVVAAAIAVTAANGNQDVFDDFASRFGAAATPQEQLRYLYALATFPDVGLALRAAEMAVSDAVRSQNAPFLVQRALHSREYGPVVWEFVRDHWATIEERFPRTLQTRMLEGVTWLVDDASVRTVPEFVAGHPIPEGERVIAQHLEHQRVHRALVERERAAFTEFVRTAALA